LRIVVNLCLLFSTLVLEAQPTFLEKADSLYALGNYTKAINEYAKVGSLTAKLQIARAYNAIGNYDKAIRQYKNVTGTDSTLQIGKFELGKLLLKVKGGGEASVFFLNLAGKDSANPEYRYYLGESLQEMGLKDASIAAYKSAVAIDSTHLRSIFRLGKYYVAQREKNMALKYINQGLRFYENDVALINLKALAYFNNDEYEKGKPLFERLLELGEDKEHIYNKLAYCYYKNWELDKAKEMYTALLAFSEARPDAFFGLGNTSWRVKELDSAAIYFKKAIEEKKPYLGNEFNALARLARVQDDLKTA
jgi:tetratricopeptide (TPR) repeat protein